MRIKLFIGFCAVYFLSNCTLAQTVGEFESIKKSYPNDDACFYLNRESINIDFKKGNLWITTSQQRKTMLLTDKTNIYSQQQVYYMSQMEELASIKAQTLIPDNNKYSKINVEEIEDVKTQRSGIFYDDTRMKQFTFPGLKMGAITSVDFEKIIKDPHFLGMFLFQTYIPTHEAEFSVTFPEEVKLKYYLKDDQNVISFSKTSGKGKTTYKWKASNLNSVKYFSDSPDLAHFAPHISIYIDSYELNGSTIPVFSGLSQYHKWAYNNCKFINLKTDENLKAFTDSLVGGIEDESQKIKRIYYWVQENIKYIAFADGMGGFIPREAGLVFERKFGDCKDKSSLLNEMLKYAGIKSYLTLIGTRDIPYTYDQLPTSNADNHMIVGIEDEKSGWQFLDGTCSSLPYGYAPYNIQGKEALVILDSSKFEVVKVAEVPMEKNYRFDTINVSLTGRNIVGTSSTMIGGLFRHSFSDNVSYVSEKEKNDALQDKMRFGNSKCTFESFTFKGLHDFSDTLLINSTFTIPDYAQVVDGNIYVNLSLYKAYQNDLIEIDKRKVNKEFQYKFLSTQFISIIIPENYKLSKLPLLSSFDSGKYGYTISYSIHGNTVIMERKLFIDTLLLEVDKFKEWNDFISSLNNAYGQVLVFQK